MKMPGAMLGEVLAHTFKKSANTNYPFAKAQMPDNFRGKLVSPQDWLKFWSGARHEPEPDKARQHRGRIPELMFTVELLQRVHRRSLLPTQALPHLRPEGAPIVRVGVAFIPSRVERAHGGEHGFASVDGCRGRWRGLRSWTSNGRLCAGKAGARGQYE